MFVMTELKHKSEITPEFSSNVEQASDRAAGGLIISKSTGDILIALRSSEVENPETYGIFGGRFDDFESPEEALEREIFEETGYPIFGTYQQLSIFYSKDSDFAYHTHIAFAPDNFQAELNWEHDSAKWVSLEELTEMNKDKLHQGVAKLIENAAVMSELTIITNHYKSKLSKEHTNDQKNELYY
jgi:8-oxo-dGTP pyrophosphatase MutT (NUDIX family)